MWRLQHGCCGQCYYCTDDDLLNVGEPTFANRAGYSCNRRDVVRITEERSNYVKGITYYTILGSSCCSPTCWYRHRCICPLQSPLLCCCTAVLRCTHPHKVSTVQRSSELTRVWQKAERAAGKSLECPGY